MAVGYSYAPTVRGRITQAHCRIVARFPAYAAKALCKGVFLAPNKAARRVIVGFSLSGIGVVNPDCSSQWQSSPYCAGKNRFASDRR